MPKDPIMLLSFVNLKLRDYYSDVDEMCKALDEDKEEIDRILNSAGYKYDKNLNQYK